MKSKTLWGFYLLSMLLAAPALVQAQQGQDSMVTRANIKDNTIFWQQGKLVQHKGGQLTEVTAPVEYSNGTVVTPDGKVRSKDGKTYTLQQKHAVSPQGRIVLVADDIFTHNTIVEHERKVVGDTETRIVTVDGQMVMVGSGKDNVTYPLALQKRTQLLEQKIKLLEERAALLEKNMKPAERRKIEGYHNGLNKQLTAVNQQLQALPLPKK